MLLESVTVMIFGVEFRQPLLLLLLVLVPLVYWLARRSQGHIIISSLSLFRHPQRSWRSRLHWLPAACLTLAAALMVVAAAGPRVGDRDSVVQRDRHHDGHRHPALCGRWISLLGEPSRPDWMW